MICPLCSYEFEATLLACHSSCAFNESCGIICCPNCGYQVPDERKSRLAGALRRFLSRKPDRTEYLTAVRPLSTLLAGQTGKITTINSDNHARVERLNVLGLTADALVRVDQKRPTYVLSVGFTELTVEREIADDILVELMQ